MIIFKILLIALISLPFAGLTAGLYSQVISYIRGRDRADKERMQRLKGVHENQRRRR